MAKQSGFSLIVLALALGWGAFVRVSHLNNKVVWLDEVYTLLYTSGQTAAETLERAQAAKPERDFSLSDVGHLIKNHSASTSAIVGMFARYSPHHPPFYYVLQGLGAQLWGNSVTNARGWSALFGTLLILGVFLLGQELLPQSPLGVVWAAMVAVSPYFTAYSQDAREYSLWSLLIVVTLWSLLRAAKKNTIQSWAVYSVSLALLLNTSLMAFFILAPLFVWVFGRGHRLRLQKHFLTSTALAALSFLPWVIVSFLHWQRIEDRTLWARSVAPSLKTVLLGIFESLQTNILDPAIWGDFYNRYNEGFFLLLFMLFVISLSFFARPQNRHLAAVVAGLGLCPLLALGAFDYLKGGHTVMVSRYLVQSHVAFHLILASGVTSFFVSSRPFHKTVASIFMLLILAAGLSSQIPGRVEPGSLAKLRYEVPVQEIKKKISEDRKTLVMDMTDPEPFSFAYLNVISLALNRGPDLNLRLWQGGRSPLPVLKDFYVFAASDDDLKRLNAQARVSRLRFSTAGWGRWETYDVLR